MADKKSTTSKSSAAKEPKYIGPAYIKGILMPDGRTIRPKEASAKEAKEMIAKYPKVERYFKNL